MTQKPPSSNLPFNCASKRRVSKSSGVKTRSFSIRLTDLERAELERRAGNRSLGDYIRSQLFGDGARVSKRRSPRDADVVYAQALASMGQSDMAASLRSMAASARVGALPITPGLVDTIETACRKIQTACDGLIAQLGVKPK